MLRIITYVLDDDIEELELLRPHLEKACGVELKMFTDIEKFVRAIDEGIHIAIIDHKLNAGTDGIEVGKRVLRKNRLVWLILFSGSGDKMVWQKAMNAGFRGGIDKNDEDSFSQLERMITGYKKEIEGRVSFYEAFTKKYSKYLT